MPQDLGKAPSRQESRARPLHSLALKKLKPSQPQLAVSRGMGNQEGPVNTKRILRLFLLPAVPCGFKPTRFLEHEFGRSSFGYDGC